MKEFSLYKTETMQRKRSRAAEISFDDSMPLSKQNTFSKSTSSRINIHPGKLARIKMKVF